MVSSSEQVLAVECSGFNVLLNCSRTTLMSHWVRTSCCKEYAAVTHDTSPQVSLKSWYKCCESLTDSGLGSMPPKWEKSSYHAYIMGIAVFGILLCLFISGARSIRRRRMLLAQAQQRRSGPSEVRDPFSGNTAQCINTQISLGPPTYGELEASGLTKDYKMESAAPPPYPGNVDDTEGYIQCLPAENFPVEDRENPPTVSEETTQKEDDGSTEQQIETATANSSLNDNSPKV